MVLGTAPIPNRTHLAISLPYQSTEPAESLPASIPQHPWIDVDLSTAGVEARWIHAAADASPTSWRGWLPHADLDVALRLTAGSAGHDDLWRAVALPAGWRQAAALHACSPLLPPPTS